MDAAQLGPLYVALVSSAAGLIIAVAGLGIAYLKMIGRKINDEKLQSSYNTTLDVVDDTLRAVLLDASDNIKKKVADGVLTKEEIIAFQDEIVKETSTKVAPAILERAKQHIGDLGKAIETRVKSKIQEVDRVTR